MPLRIWTGPKEFETTHERRALSRLVREMITRFRKSPDPYALFIDFSVRGSKIDLLALTSRAVVIIDLKDVGHPDGVVDGTENGPWYIEFPGGSSQGINVGRKNPYQQIDGYRYSLIEWFEAEGEQIFGAQRKNQLQLAHIDAWVAVTPSIDEEGTIASLSFLPAKVLTWFRVLGFNRLCDELYATVTPGIELYEEDISKIARHLGLYEKVHLFDMVVPDELEIPQPRIFSKPYVHRFHLNRDNEMNALLAAMESSDYSVLAIGGPGGVGKTHMAGMLSELVTGQYKVYWIYCAERPELTLETLLLAFANELSNPRQAQFVADPDESQNARMDVVLEYFDSEGVCLVLDDYHVLSTPGGVDSFLQRLDRRCRRAKAVLTTRRRPDFCQDMLSPMKGFWEITLSGLPSEDTVEYMRQQPASLRLRLSEADCPIIWEKTGGGVPKVMDMLASLSVGRSPADVAVGMDVYSDERAEQWFQSLLAQVSKEARRMAHGASVIRGALSPELLTALCDRIDAERCINELADNYILLWDQGSGQYTLNNLLIGYLYNRLNPTTRRRYHERAAQWLFDEAKAGESAYERIAMQAEALYHAQASASWNLVLDRAHPVMEQLNWWGEWPRARSICEWALAAAESAKESREIARWSLELARQLRHIRERAKAAEYCRRGLDLAEQIESQELCAKAYHELGMLAYAQRNMEEALAWHERALELDRIVGKKPHIAASLGKLGDIARIRGHFDEALARYRESAQLSEESGDHAALSITYTQLGTLEKYAGTLEQARAYFTQALQNAELSNRPTSVAIALGQLGEVAGRLGEYEDALMLIDQSLSMRRDLVDPRSHRMGLGIRVDILIAAGRLEEAEEALAELDPLIPEDDAFGQAFNRKRRGLLSVQHGQAESGSAKVREAAAFFESKGYAHYAKDCERSLQAMLAKTG